MTTTATDAPDDLVERLTDEADLCINDGADDIAKLLMSAASRIVNLTERDRRCPTMEEAEARALLRGLMGCADEMGLSHESSPAAVVDALQCLKRRHAQMMLSAEAQADERESALVAERDSLRALLNDLGGTFHRLDTYGFIQAVGDEDENLCAHFLSCGRETMKQVVSALAAPAVEGK